MADDHTLSREHATTQRAGPHEDPLTASSGRPSDERVTGQGPGVLSAPVVACSLRHQRGVLSSWCLRMTSEVHISSPVPSMCLRAKDHVEGTKVAVTEEWRPGYPKRSRRPRERELSGRVTLRPPPVCTGRGRRWFTHGAGTAYAPCSPVFLHAPCLGASWKASCLSPTWQCVKWAKVACKRSTTSREMQSERRTFPSTPMRSHGSRDRSRRCVAALPCQESRQDRG